MNITNTYINVNSTYASVFVRLFSYLGNQCLHFKTAQFDIFSCRCHVLFPCLVYDLFSMYLTYTTLRALPNNLMFFVQCIDKDMCFCAIKMMELSINIFLLLLIFRYRVDQIVIFYVLCNKKSVFSLI